jgi:microcystin-dependent protein
MSELISYDYNFTAGSTAVADQVNGNFNKIKTAHNDLQTNFDNLGSSLIGSVCDSFIDLNSAYYADLSSSRTLSRTKYTELYNLIVASNLIGTGKPFGVGDGSTTFTTPVIKGQSIIAFDATDTDFNAVGKTGGEKTHTLSTAEMPLHNHSVDPPATSTGGAGGHSHSINDPGHNHLQDGESGYSVGANSGNVRGVFDNNQGTGWGFTGISINAVGDHSHLLDIGAFSSGNAGSGNAHNNLQPFYVLKKFMRIK